MDKYIKKHTFLFIITFLIIIMVLIYSFFLIDNSNFSNQKVILSNLKISYQNEYISVTKSNSLDDLSDNYVYISNNTESREKFKIYIDSSEDLTGLYYKVDNNELKYLKKNKLVYEGTINPRTKLTLNIKFGTNKDINVSNIKFILK